MITTSASQRSRGSATLVALGLGIVLLIIIAGVRSFTSYRIQNTIIESRTLKALAIAEAGLAFAISELANNYTFVTHKVNANLTWAAEEPTSQTLKADSTFNFTVRSATKGTYSGTLGDGEYKVRCGPIPYKDDPRTLNIDESKAFFYVESMGKIGDTVRIVRAVVQRRFPGREFLMYDGGFLSIVYGTPGLDNVNKFSTGHLYGHLGIEIGRILNIRQSPCSPGTNQELYDMNSIISGDGGIFLYNDIKAQFRARPGLPALDTYLRKNADFPRNGTYVSEDARKNGSYPAELLETNPPIHDPDKVLADRVKDKSAHVSIPPKPLPFETYKGQATRGGIYLSSTDCNQDYPVTQGWPSSGGNKLKVKILDFGTQLRQGNVTIPANFNGVIFSDGPLVIKGNPPREVKIVSRKDIFVAGDFNQAGDPNASGGSGQNPQRYGFPQNYAENAMKNEDYIDASRALLTDDHDTTKFQHHKPATIIAHDRIVFDYRSPIDCFENELYPYMKYKIAEKLKDESSARNSILKISGTGGIQTNAPTGAIVKNCIASYFEDFPLLDSGAETALADKFAQHRDTSGAIYNDTDFDNLCRSVWKKYVELYEAKKMERNSPSDGKFGVYKLLKALRNEMRNGTAYNSPLKPDQSDDFLFYPEMTTNGMFISCGKRNREFYAGPDYIKLFDEIGSDETCVPTGVGLKHSDRGEMIHRLFGSEIRLELYQIQRITGGSYTEPTRRKLYDESLPRMTTEAGSLDYAAFRLLSWRDERVSPDAFNEF